MREKEKCFVYIGTKIPAILKKDLTIEKMVKAFCEHNNNYTSEEVKDELQKIKIGETSNLTRRKNDLRRDGDCTIVNYIEWEGTKAQRFFVESYVRMKIENSYSKNVTHFGNDHFKCSNSKIIKAIANHFEQWALEGLELSKAI